MRWLANSCRHPLQTGIDQVRDAEPCRGLARKLHSFVVVVQISQIMPRTVGFHDDREREPDASMFGRLGFVDGTGVDLDDDVAEFRDAANYGHAQTGAERSANALRDYFGSFRAKPCASAPKCSHFGFIADADETSKTLILQGFYGRSERI